MKFIVILQSFPCIYMYYINCKVNSQLVILCTHIINLWSSLSPFKTNTPLCHSYLRIKSKVFLHYYKFVLISLNKFVYLSSIVLWTVNCCYVIYTSIILQVWFKSFYLKRIIRIIGNSLNIFAFQVNHHIYLKCKDGILPSTGTVTGKVKY